MKKSKSNKKRSRPERKASIKKLARSAPAVKPGAMAIIPFSEIARPETYKNSLSLIPTPFTENQIKSIVAPTPRHIISKRPGKGGGEWDYVPGWWFKKKLNFVFGFAHDFNILGERVDGDFITVKGQLVVKHPKTGQTLASKTDFGGAAIKYHKDKPHKPEHYLDISNDFKAAATDCLKRCAVQMGFAMDVYGVSESKQEGTKIVNQPTPPQRPPAPEREVIIPPKKQAAVDYVAKLHEFLEKKGYKTDKQKVDYIAANSKIKIYDIKTLKPSMAQVVLSQLIRYDATR